jgi:hypothetical protein
MVHPLSSEQTAKWYVNLFKQILATGEKKIRPVPVFIQPNGLAGVKDSLQYMHDGKVSPTQPFTLTFVLAVAAALIRPRPHLQMDSIH